MKEIIVSILGLSVLISQIAGGTLPGVPSGSQVGSSGFRQLILVEKENPGLPKKLIIPALGVDTSIEAVGQDSEGRMAIPKNIFNAGWYELGFRPGEQGNAVIDGHINTPELKPNIFANLDRLKPGDTVIVEDEKEKSWNFQVTQVAHYRTDNFPLALVFGSAGKPQLNLVTCDGFYQKAKDDYSQRTVVFTELVNSS